MDAYKQARGKEMYQIVCDALDARDWRYGKDEEKLLVHYGVNGDDIPMDFILYVDAERQLIRLMSPMKMKMSEDKRVEGAIATCVASYGMADGCFDYDMTEGRIVFRLVASYRESRIGQGLIQYMISCAIAMVDHYNHQFLALDKGMIDIQKFMEMNG